MNSKILSFLCFAVLVLGTVLSGFGQVSTSGAVPLWRSSVPVSCTDGVRSQALLYHYTSDTLYKCSGGSYVAIGGGGAESPLELTSAAAGDVPITLQFAASPTAPAFRIKDSSGVALAEFLPPSIGYYKTRLWLRGYYATDGAYLDEQMLYLNNTGYGTSITVQANYANSDARIYSNLPVVINGGGAGTYGIKIDSSTTAGQTRFFLYDVDNGQFERVTVGAADSCGTGYKCLRIPN